MRGDRDKTGWLGYYKELSSSILVQTFLYCVVHIWETSDKVNDVFHCRYERLLQRSLHEWGQV